MNVSVTLKSTKAYTGLVSCMGTIVIVFNFKKNHIIMFYVAKKYSALTPVIVEQFQSRSLAKKYADVMNEAGKGEFIVLALLSNHDEKETNE